MTAGDIARDDAPHMHGFERLLTLWVLLCMAAGIALGRIAPGFAKRLDGMTLDVGGAPVVSIPIAVCLFFMMYPIMVKIDFDEVREAGRNLRPVLLTLFVNWCVKPFTMLAPKVLPKTKRIRQVISVELLESRMDGHARLHARSIACRNVRPDLNSSFKRSKISTFASTAIPILRMNPAIPGSVNTTGTNLNSMSDNRV